MDVEIGNITNLLLGSSAWKIALFVIVSMVVTDVLKNISGIIFEFISLKTDLIGIGTTVEYEGRTGIVRYIGLRRLTIDFTNSDGSVTKVYVLLSEWRKMRIVYNK